MSEKKFRAIVIREELVQKLEGLKIHPRQSYSEVVAKLLEEKEG